MAAEKTGPDAIREYMTGADSDGGVQTDPDASIGKFRSSTELGYLGDQVVGLQAGLTVDFVSGNCLPGIASIVTKDADTLAFIAPNGTEGPPASIADTETKILLDGTNKSQYARVTRTGAVAFSGTATLTLTDIVNNVIGSDNVTSAEATAGQSDYRCFTEKNEGGTLAPALRLLLYTLGTQQITDTTQLGASGAGTIETTGTFADAPDSGFARITQAGGTLREIAYYESRSNGELVFAATGRGLLGTSAGAGAADDTVDFVPGLRLAAEKVIRDPFQTTGTGLDDLSAGGRLVDSTAAKNYVIKITIAAATDEFQWSDDGGSTFNGVDIPITGLAQTLQDGVTVTFLATIGHTAADEWSFLASEAASEPADETTEPGATGGADGAAFVWYTSIDPAVAAFFEDLADGYMVHIWANRVTPEGATSDPSVLNRIRKVFDI